MGQLAPIGEGGLGGVVANLVRYVGWAGDGGVPPFLIASGFALTWGLLRAAEGRGAIFITRLPEFAFGIALAAWMAKQPEPIDRGLRRISTLASAAVVYAAGTGLASDDPQAPQH